jgi:hypothetical protein
VPARVTRSQDMVEVVAELPPNRRVPQRLVARAVVGTCAYGNTTDAAGLNEMKEIPLTQGKVALVDDEDYAWLSQFNWYADNRGDEFWRAARQDLINKTVTVRKVYMHDEICPAPSGLTTAHVSHDGLDNRRSNLYVATRSQILSRKRVKPRDLPRGVAAPRGTGGFRAQITVRRKNIFLGSFETMEAAHEAYETARGRYYGAEFSNPTDGPWRKSDVQAQGDEIAMCLSGSLRNDRVGNNCIPNRAG